jgi:hypothetical protein
LNGTLAAVVDFLLELSRAQRKRDGYLNFTTMEENGGEEIFTWCIERR